MTRLLAIRAAALALSDAIEPLVPAFVGCCAFAGFLILLGAPHWFWVGITVVLFWTVTRERVEGGS